MVHKEIISFPLSMPPDAKAVVVRAQRNALKRKSIRLFFKTLEISGENADDFVRQRASILMTFEAYKVPRIVKNYLLK